MLAVFGNLETEGRAELSLLTANGLANGLIVCVLGLVGAVKKLIFEESCSGLLGNEPLVTSQLRGILIFRFEKTFRPNTFLGTSEFVMVGVVFFLKQKPLKVVEIKKGVFRQILLY